MTKPHEEEWTHNGRWIEMAKAPEQRRKTTRPASDSGNVTIARHEGDGGIERARLASKAPKMARALLYAREQFRMQMDGDPEWHRKGRVEDLAAGIDALLREAGVLE